MKLALIQNNKVINVIIADSESVSENYSEFQVIRVDQLNPEPGINWDFINNEFIQPKREDI